MPLGVTRHFWMIELAQTYLLRLLGALWIFFLGSCFASFLNVVAWRVPRGRTINGSSHCPDCDQRLSFRDNTPILGWLRNNGHCSNCGLPIPTRYLIVEFILGFVFLGIGTIELALGGINLPFRTIEKIAGLEQLIAAPQWDLIQLTSYHLTLICLLFTLALIKSENLKVPYSVWITGLIFGTLIPLVWPNVSLINWNWSTEVLSADRFSIDQYATLGIGLVAGAILGFIVNGFDRRFVPEHPYVFQKTFISEAVASLSLVGLFLGWQSALSIGLAAMGVSIILTLFTPRAIWSSLSTAVFASTLFHLVAWRQLTQSGVWPSAQASVLVTLLAILSFTILAWLKAKLERIEIPESTNEIQTEA